MGLYKPWRQTICSFLLLTSLIGCTERKSHPFTPENTSCVVIGDHNYLVTPVQQSGDFVRSGEDEAFILPRGDGNIVVRLESKGSNYEMEIDGSRIEGSVIGLRVGSYVVTVVNGIVHVGIDTSNLTEDMIGFDSVCGGY